jgi:hypothetical protein
MKQTLWTFAFGLYVGSCAPVYIPNTVNTPLLTGQNEFQLSGSAGSNGLDLQGAYAVTDEIGIMANMSLADQEQSTSSDYHKHNFKEFGIGYMTPMGRRGVFEVYTGYGWGTASSRDTYDFFGTNSVAAEGSYRRFFIQPSAGTRRANLHAALSTRLAWVTFTRFESAATVQKKDYTRFFLEPVFTTRFGFEYFKIQAQMGLSLPLTQQKTFEGQPVIINVGLFLNFNHSDGEEE